MKKIKTKIWLCVFVFFLSQIIFAQIEDDAKKDSIENKRDFGESLDNLKDKSKFNKFLHRLLVRRVSTKKGEITSEKYGEVKSNYNLYEGKIIRKIKIQTYDPFGYSITDSTETPKKIIEKVGNTAHARTKNFVVRNYILVEEGDKFDSLKILESQRLLRQQRFIRRVVIDISPTSENSDSIDLVVKTLDSWSIVPNFEYSGSKVGLRLRDRNFLGLGHNFDNRYRQDFETGNNRFQTSYTIPNIQRTFISFSAGYYSNEENDYNKGISVQRRFFSPLTRWAGGIYIGQRTYQDSIPNNFGLPAQDMKYNYQDYWGGYSFRLFKDLKSTSARQNNLIFSGRYFNVDYKKNPLNELDQSNFYSNENFYLLGIGVSRRGFVQDRFIYNYDIVEDIPIGMSYGITSGIQRKNQKNRIYLAVGFKMGNYYELGFFGFEINYGGFYSKNSKPEQNVFSFRTNYYTRLMTWGKWKFRNFISTDLILGVNRINSRGDRLTFNENDPSGISGFNSLEVIGTKKWLTHIQIQTYSPYEFLGFRFSPFLNSSIGLISNDDNHLLKGKFYTKVGMGIMFTNDYLVFSNFQLSLAWYNTIPGSGDNIIKTNAFDNNDYELMDFEFGKPELIEYSPNTVY